MVLALGTKDDSRQSQLPAGEVTSLVLLTPTALGLASCPVTEPLEITETRDAVLDAFGISGSPRCCCGSAGHPSMPTRCRRLPAAPSRMPLSGS